MWMKCLLRGRRNAMKELARLARTALEECHPLLQAWKGARLLARPAVRAVMPSERIATAQATEVEAPGGAGLRRSSDQRLPRHAVVTPRRAAGALQKCSPGAQIKQGRSLALLPDRRWPEAAAAVAEQLGRKVQRHPSAAATTRAAPPAALHGEAAPGRAPGVAVQLLPAPASRVDRAAEAAVLPAATTVGRHRPVQSLRRLRITQTERAGARSPRVPARQESQARRSRSQKSGQMPLHGRKGRKSC